MAHPAHRQRRRLNSLDKLPDDCREDVAWAYEAIRDRQLEQGEILDELNRRLEVKGEGPISRSAFSRASIRVARMGQRLEETREIAAAVSEKLDVGGGEDVTLLLSETIKMMVYEMLENAGELSADSATAKMMSNLSAALYRAEQSRKLSAEVRAKIEREFAKEAEEAVDKVARKQGLTGETVAAIKTQILGIRKD